ncbi:MAG: MerC domain-containing protein [Candidatus Obscuribacterales bacterium]|jgi:hypothetical protein|nr:MerC domain-containing protein [Candidatus Obscuribacterales bacterium]
MRKVTVDHLGIIASTVCILHCALTPYLGLAVLPLLGLKHDLTHAILAGFVLAFALFSVIPNYLKHKDRSSLLIAVLGLTLVLTASFNGERLGEMWEIVLISVGNIIVIYTHNKNRKLCLWERSQPVSVAELNAISTHAAEHKSRESCCEKTITRKS